MYDDNLSGFVSNLGTAILQTQDANEAKNTNMFTKQQTNSHFKSIMV